MYFCTMIKNNIPLKVALGYAAVAVVMALAVALVYSNTQSILNIDKASRDYTHKRNMADSLVYSLLDVSNNERSIYMETSGNWEELNHSISEAKVQALKLKGLPAESTHGHPRQSAQPETSQPEATPESVDSQQS